MGETALVDGLGLFSGKSGVGTKHGERGLFVKNLELRVRSST